MTRNSSDGRTDRDNSYVRKLFLESEGITRAYCIAKSYNDK